MSGFSTCFSARRFATPVLFIVAALGFYVLAVLIKPVPSRTDHHTVANPGAGEALKKQNEYLKEHSRAKLDVAMRKLGYGILPILEEVM
jgi:hypothetical protein